MSSFKQYKNVRSILYRYWLVYGGFSDVIKSPYFHLSILITLLSWSFWNSGEWHVVVINIMPNILGFSLGGYAILLSFGNEDFIKSLIRGNQKLLISSDKLSYKGMYMTVNATFVHFILLQILAILLALLNQAKFLEALRIKNCLHVMNHIDCEFNNNHPWYESSLNVLDSTYSFVGYLVFVYSLVSAIAVTLNIFRLASWFNYHHMTKEINKKDQ